MTTQAEEVLLSSEAVINEEPITQTVEEQPQNTRINREIVSLPYEIQINENKIIIHEIRGKGTVEIDGKLFVYKTVDERELFEDDISLTLYKKNNLLGMSIQVQYSTGGVVCYTLIINTETQEEILLLEKDANIWHIFLRFFSVENNFIVIFSQIAYAFNDLTGELLWFQTFGDVNYNRRIITYEDHFVIDERDGNMYMIFGDGRKEKILH